MGEPLHDFRGVLLAGEVEEELLDVLDLECALLEGVLLDQVFGGHLKMIVRSTSKLQLPNPKALPIANFQTNAPNDNFDVEWQFCLEVGS